MTLITIVAIGLFICAVINTKSSAMMMGEIFHPVFSGRVRLAAIGYAVVTTVFWWSALTIVLMIVTR